MKKPGPWFYGWWIVVASFATLGITYGFRYYVFGVFLKPMSAELGWDRAATASVYSLSMILEYALAFFVGRVVDRYGPRRVMTIGALVGALGFASVALVTELWHYYFLYAFVTTIGVAMVGMIPVSTALTNWFFRKRSTAMGIATSSVSVGSIILVPTASWILEDFGWRWAWVFLGVIMLVVITPVVALLMRRSPEAMGLLPDGASAEPDSARHGTTRPAREESWTLGEAVRTRTFWYLSIGGGFGAMPVAVFAVHIFPFATDLGISPAGAAAAVGLSSLISLPGRIFFGWLGDRMDKRLVLNIVQVGMILGFIAFAFTDSPFRLYLGVILAGLFLGGSVPVQTALTAEIFGRSSMGSIFGLRSLVTIIIYAVGPVTAGYLFDATGGYRWGFGTMTVSLVIACVLTHMVHRPVRQIVVLAAQR